MNTHIKCHVYDSVKRTACATPGSQTLSWTCFGRRRHHRRRRQHRGHPRPHVRPPEQPRLGRAYLPLPVRLLSWVLVRRQLLVAPLSLLTPAQTQPLDGWVRTTPCRQPLGAQPGRRPHCATAQRAHHHRVVWVGVTAAALRRRTSTGGGHASAATTPQSTTTRGAESKSTGPRLAVGVEPAWSGGGEGSQGGEAAPPRRTCSARVATPEPPAQAQPQPQPQPHP